MQHLNSTDPTQDTSLRSCGIHGSHQANRTWIMQIRDLSSLKDLDDELGIDDTDDTDDTDHLSEV